MLGGRSAWHRGEPRRWPLLTTKRQQPSAATTDKFGQARSWHARHMAPNCRIDIPANTESTDVGATSSPDLFLLRHSVRDRDQGHPFLFAPKEQRADGWLPVMRAAQNPQSCSRYLLVADDMKQAGLGYTGRMLASTLLLAIRQRRVLHEVPLTNQTTGIQYGRWCHQPPYTLQCAFEPWSSCPLPASALAVSFEATCQLPTKVRNISGRAVNSRPAFDHMCLFKMNAPVVRIQLTSIYSMTALYQKPGDGAFGVLRAAHRFLYVPRPNNCVVRPNLPVGSHSTNFVSSSSFSPGSSFSSTCWSVTIGGGVGGGGSVAVSPPPPPRSNSCG